MLIEDEQEKKVYGKTGSGTNGEAWFIGFTEKGQQREYFAVYILKIVCKRTSFK